MDQWIKLIIPSMNKDKIGIVGNKFIILSLFTNTLNKVNILLYL
jgi:hypothetical protein